MCVGEGGGEMYVILAAVSNKVVYMSVGRGGGWGGGGGGALACTRTRVGPALVASFFVLFFDLFVCFLSLCVDALLFTCVW